MRTFCTDNGDCAGVVDCRNSAAGIKDNTAKRTVDLLPCLAVNRNAILKGTVAGITKAFVSFKTDKVSAGCDIAVPSNNSRTRDSSRVGTNLAAHDNDCAVGVSTSTGDRVVVSRIDYVVVIGGNSH